MKVKWVMRRAPGIYRVARLLWQRGRPGFGGHSDKLSLAISARPFGFRAERDDWEVTVLWLRVHHLRSHGGIIV
jgi:hypothetical protein